MHHLRCQGLADLLEAEHLFAKMNRWAELAGSLVGHGNIVDCHREHAAQRSRSQLFLKVALW